MSSDQITRIEGGSGYGSFSASEKRTFVRFANDAMQQAVLDDADRMQYHWPHDISIDPLDPDNELFARFRDGVVLCTLINRVAEGSIDMRVVNKVSPSSTSHVLKLPQMHENLSLALKAAKEIGCIVVNIGTEDFVECRVHAVFGLLWQLLRLDFAKNSLSAIENIQVISLKKSEESVEQFLKLDDRELLMRWLNVQMQRDGKLGDRAVGNFGGDLKDSTVYLRLLRTVVPHLVAEDEVQAALQEEDLYARAAIVVELVQRIDMKRRVYIDANDIVTGQTRINAAFLAAIFDSCVDTSMQLPEMDDPQAVLALRAQILDIALASLAKEMPSVRSAKFTAFMQAAKNLSRISKSSQESTPQVLDSLKKVQEEALELRNKLLGIEESSLMKEEESASAFRAMQTEALKLSDQLQAAQQMLQDKELRIQDVSRQSKREQQQLRAKISAQDIELTEMQLQVKQQQFQAQLDKDAHEQTIADIKQQLEAKDAVIAELSRQMEEHKAEADKRQKELQAQLEAEKKQAEQLAESKKSQSEKLRDLVTRFVKLKDDMRRTRQDLNYGMSIAGADAEQKLAVHRFGSLACEALEPRSQKKGFMRKKGSQVKNIKQRFFVLVDSFLFYYEKVTDRAPKGFIRLDEAKINDNTTDQTIDIQCFGGRSLFLYCDSLNDCQQWCWALKAASSISE